MTRIDEEIEANRNIVEKACGLYKQLLKYAVEKNGTEFIISPK